MSALVAHRKTSSEAFSQTYPHPWLVWELEGFKPTSMSVKETRTTPTPSGSRPIVATPDPLCFELKDRSPFKVGRAPDCDVRVNDATVSREHLWFEPQDEGVWLARPASPSSITYVNGEVLTPAGRRLAPGEVIAIGTVRLTYESLETMLKRLSPA